MKKVVPSGDTTERGAYLLAKLVKPVDVLTAPLWSTLPITRRVVGRAVVVGLAATPAVEVSAPQS